MKHNYEGQLLSAALDPGGGSGIQRRIQAYTCRISVRAKGVSIVLPPQWGEWETFWFYICMLCENVALRVVVEEPIS